MARGGGAAKRRTPGVGVPHRASCKCPGRPGVPARRSARLVPRVATAPGAESPWTQPRLAHGLPTPGPRCLGPCPSPTTCPAWRTWSRSSTPSATQSTASSPRPRQPPRRPAECARVRAPRAPPAGRRWAIATAPCGVRLGRGAAQRCKARGALIAADGRKRLSVVIACLLAATDVCVAALPCPPI